MMRHADRLGIGRAIYEPNRHRANEMLLRSIGQGLKGLSALLVLLSLCGVGLFLWGVFIGSGIWVGLQLMERLFG